jgi:DNA-binding NarL/FixJ family response regulator
MNTVKVFLADQHEWFRRSLADFVRSHRGFEVVGEAADGEEVSANVRNLHPDLVLMDFHLPRRNGLETARAIKQIAPQTKVVILSVHPERQYREEAKQNLADEFIDKSVMKNELSALLSILRPQAAV